MREISPDGRIGLRNYMRTFSTNLKKKIKSPTTGHRRPEMNH